MQSVFQIPSDDPNWGGRRTCYTVARYLCNKGTGRLGATNKKSLAFILECDGGPEVLAGKVKGMAE